VLFKLAIWGITPNSINLPNSTDTVSKALAETIQLIITLAGMLAVLMIMYAGIQMALSAGSPQRFAKGRATLLYAVGGLVVAIAALAIVTFVTTNIH
jgi:hypothetical protein